MSIAALCLTALAFIQGPQNLNDRSLGSFVVDVVNLIDKKSETPGKESLFVDRYGYRYLFASQTNRDAFLAKPEKYEVQLGGACGSMGPLSGRGSATRYAVYQDRLYTFASDGCRTRFLANADKLIDRDEPQPSGDAMARQAGKALLDKVVEWCGGAAKIDAVRAYRETVEEEVLSGGAKYRHVETLSLRFPGDIVTKSQWNESTFTNVSTPKDGFFLSNSGQVEPMHPVQRRSLERLRDQRLIAILKARRDKDFMALSSDSGPEPELQVWFGGSAASIRVDSKSGMPLGIAFNGRGPGALIGAIKQTYTGYSEFGGIRLPNGWEGAFEGEPNKSVSAANVRFDFNDEGIDTKRPKS